MKRRNLRAAFAALAAVATATFVLAAPEVLAFDDEDVRVLENARMRLEFARVALPGRPTRGAIVLRSLVDVGTATGFETASSPLVSVELRSLFDPAVEPHAVMVPRQRCAPGSATACDPDGPRVVHPIVHDLDSLAIEDTEAGGVRLVWSGLPVPGSDQTLDVAATVELRSDLRSIWNVRATVSGDGPYSVFAIRFPLLSCRRVRDAAGGDGAPDQLLLPINGGLTIEDPAGNPNSLAERHDEGARLDGVFTYPGCALTQFLAYYDPSLAGIFLQAEDPRGATKNVYGSSEAPPREALEGRTYFYFTHFNSLPSVAEMPDAAARRVAALDFDVAADLGYPVALETFRGDWIDAALLYRGWAERTRAEFLPEKLSRRDDFTPEHKRMAFGLKYKLPRDGGPIDAAAEYERVQSILRYFKTEVQDVLDPEGAIECRALFLPDLYESGRDAVGRDGRVNPLRENAADLFAALRSPRPGDLPIVGVSFNRDTAGVEATDPGLEEIARKAGMRTSRQEPMIMSDGVRRTCLGSPWLGAARARIATELLDESRCGEPLCAPGFDAGAETGNGNWSYLCFAPLTESPDVDSGAHDHPAGGGTYLAEGWIRLARSLRAAAAREGAVPFLLGFEHHPETVISEFLVNGHSWLAPLDDTAPGVATTVDDSTPVPLFRFLYHDYTLWQGSPPFFTEYASVYGGSLPPGEMLLARYRMTQLAQAGRILSAAFAHESPLEDVPSSPLLPPAIADEHRLFAALALLRAGLPEYLVTGRALRDPVVAPVSPSDTVSLPRVYRGETRPDFVVPRVLASAWADDDGRSVGLVLVNFTPAPAHVVVAFSPADYGLAPGKTYRFERRTGLAGPWRDTGKTFGGSDASVSEDLVVPALEKPEGGVAAPFALVRIVPAE